MQLGSSVFGIVIIQLKPQLERLLGLMPGSLTKEIQLTQDLMRLFIEYQITSDLLSFDGAHDAGKTERLDAVMEHVTAVLDVISREKEKIIITEEQKADYRESAEDPRAREMKNALYWFRLDERSLDERSIGSIGGPLSPSCDSKPAFDFLRNEASEIQVALSTRLRPKPSILPTTTQSLS